MYELRLAEFATRVDISVAGGVALAQIEHAAASWLKTSKQGLRPNA